MIDPSNKNITFPALKITKKTGTEKFNLNRRNLSISLTDFWRWSSSDLVNNTMRGILAEFIVANALGLADGVRIEWDAFDLITKDGLKIEVKSAAYIQSWSHQKLSSINFKICPTRNWNEENNKRSDELKRQADVYVFCLLHHKDKDTIDPLNLEQWEFYIIKTSVLNNERPNQKTIGLSSLLKLKPHKAKYEEIASFIETL